MSIGSSCDMQTCKFSHGCHAITISKDVFNSVAPIILPEINSSLRNEVVSASFKHAVV